MNPKPLNLLFLYTDQQAYNTLAAYGNRQIRMPKLNRLADESILFEHAYVTQPVCTPSRSSLLTGQYPHTNGCTENNIPLREDTLCLPQMIDKGPYVTGHFGKWHLGDELFAQHGFDEWVSIEDMYNRHFSEGRDRNATSSYHDFLIGKGLAPEHEGRFGRQETARLPEALSKPAFLAARASQFIRENRHRPFILYVNFLEPHPPYLGPRDSQYAPEEVPMPPSYALDLPKRGSTRARLLREHFRRHGHKDFRLQAEADWRRVIANYWGLCSLVDTHMGTILDTIDACGLRDSTVVLFTSDHGDMMGAHRLLAKTVMFQEAIRVPLLLRLPGQRCQRKVSGPVSQIDIVPTLLELLGQPLPRHLQGRSLCPVLTSSGPRMLGDVFVEWNGPDADGAMGDLLTSDEMPEWATEIAGPQGVRAAMTDPVRTIIRPDGWKLNFSPLGEHELYNLRTDPYETMNLFAENRPLARELADELRKWQDRTGDVVGLPSV